MMEFIEEVQRWAAEYLNVIIPNPGEPSVMFASYDETVNATIIDNA